MISWDIFILHQINREWTHPLLDWLMPALSAINAWLPLLILVLLLLLWHGGKRGRMTVLCCIVALCLGDAVVSNTIKKVVGRVRPRDAIENVMIRDLGKGHPEFMRLFTAPTNRLSFPRGDVRGSSFPSSHTVNMFAAATVVALFYRRAGIGVYFLAILVAYSRLYVGAHWPSDIVPSIGIGILIGWAVTRLIQRLCLRRFGAF
ncbi:MAG: phosphatase PAP2 family protein [Verrucomicrobia bacterium]|nr:phosphatase PAP2 family protein [Verrucomicrobiota bacterium]